MDNDMRTLINILNKATEAYDAGHPYMSDADWDEMYYKLCEMEANSGLVYPDSPTNHISYTIVNNLKKKEHNHLMLSLAKTKDENEFIKFIKKDEDWILMPKMDGLTLSLRYMNGELISAETRGNGEVGEDVTHNAAVVKNIPMNIGYFKELVIDGEIVCGYHNFEKFKDDYANPRNFAAGSIRLLNSKECASRYLSFYAWDCITDVAEYLSDKLDFLSGLGFTTVPYTCGEYGDLDTKLIASMKRIAEEKAVPIDGLVLKVNDCTKYAELGATEHHPLGGFAYKFYDEEYKTKLIDITYDISRMGEMTPVAIFEPIDTGDSIVERASLHNLSIMKSLCENPKVNDELTVIKSNMIIPQVVGWEHTAESADDILYPQVCPVCGKPTEIITSDAGVNILYCSNDLCPRKLVNRLDHFVGKKGLDIKGLSKATLTKLCDWEWINGLEDVFTLKDHYKEWIQISGFGIKSVDNILNAIEESKNIELWSFLASLGIPLIGEKAAKILSKNFDDYIELRKAVEDNYEFYLIDSFGPEMHSALINFDYTEADKVAKHLNIVNSLLVESNGLDLSSLTVVITGKLHNYKNRDELKDIIEAAGGKVTGSVSKKTTCLINNDTNSDSAKNKKAKELGVDILSEDDFVAKYLTL